MTTTGRTPGEQAELNALVALAEREHRAGRLSEAAAACRKILTMRPDFVEMRNNLGAILAQQGSIDAAAEQFQQALAQRPNFAEAHNNLGKILARQGRPHLAVPHFEHAIALRPDFVEAIYHLALLLLAQSKPLEAVARLERVLALRPNHLGALGQLGWVLLGQGKLDDAAARFQQVLALRPDDAHAHNNLGSIFWKQQKALEASACFERALALAPDHAEAHNNLGIILAQQNNLPQARDHFEQALAHKPDYVEAHNNLGNLLVTYGDLDRAESHYQQALDASPNLAGAELGLATCYLVKGDYRRGWPAYEARLRLPGARPLPNLPRWSGQPLEGRSLLLVAEQGIGDALQFIRYARLFKARGARVVLACKSALGPLLTLQPDLDQVLVLGPTDALPDCDYYLSLLSCPAALGTNTETIPGEVPYLVVDPVLTEKWREELAAIEGFKIGIAWQGSAGFASDRWRSMPLGAFAPLARLPDVRLISLQKAAGAEQIATVDFPVVDLAGRLDAAAGPFMDTAAVIRSLDLVVCPDTAIGHLAGALAAPVFLALQLSPNWRWLTGRDDSPWYPTMRLFRQRQFDQWPDVFRRIAAAVEVSRDRA